jgi:protein ImuB
VRPKFDQRGLFLPLTPEPQKLEITLARLSGVTGGQENVGSPEVLDTHRPDAFRMARFAPPQPTHAKQQTLHSTRETLKGALDDAKPPLQPASALRRFRPPQPVSVTTINDRPGTIGPPRSPANGEQMARAVYGEVVWCAGPWRTSGEWWNHEPWEREEWDISVSSSHFQVLNKSTAVRNPKLEAQSAPLYRLYRNLLEGTWFIEGEYD